MVFTAWLTAATTLALAGAPQRPCASAALDAGMRQGAEGSYEESLASLDRAIQELSALGPKAGCSATLAQVYFRRGMAYLGLDQPNLARASFQRTLGYERSFRPPPGELSAKAARVWQAALARHQETASFERSARSKGHRTALVILGLGAAAGGLSAATVRSEVKERENLPPTAQIIEHRPPGVPIAQLTRVTFFGSASDPDGESLVLEWTFGCGAAAATGATVTVVFSQAGEGCSVKLTARDGLGATATAETTITVAALTGVWVPTTATFCDLGHLNVTGVNATSLEVEFDAQSTVGLATVTQGYLLPPRGLYLEYSTIDSRSWLQCGESFSLSASPDMTTLTGTDDCTDALWSTHYAARVGQTHAVTFARR